MRNRTLAALSFLLPAGVFGVSVTLAGADANAMPVSPQGAESGRELGVAARLKAIRDGVSDVLDNTSDDVLPSVVEGFPNVLKAQWRNWRNGGWRPHWRNGGWGWRNGGWGPHWRNGGWRNGGWRNWRNW
ncbi:GrrA/OscA1 family cyclophane-containing rSAM-modified RiPP [Methylocapsa palsarum]|uniref:RSAM-associated Gly-rich repeat protein n=1 Tax=Methylocapsa palsarum TaxID=1612308 RepID=A0A1I3WAQ4_9HYPH|nr:GrrA/OscA1 family cyclophane-containing rSAM-modified RiPP [Methylocapsa palsarum]SFK03506.1 rSAM-associated Gly-rich repeat protein [Methylocapsa palsarum]